MSPATCSAASASSSATAMWACDVAAELDRAGADHLVSDRDRLEIRRRLRTRLPGQQPPLPLARGAGTGCHRTVRRDVRGGPVARPAGRGTDHRGGGDAEPETAAANTQASDRGAIELSGPQLAIHAHFYQPAREDPFTGHVPREPSAAPFHDWNERIAAECYQANITRGNVGRISWDLGPRWRAGCVARTGHSTTHGLRPTTGTPVSPSRTTTRSCRSRRCATAERRSAGACATSSCASARTPPASGCRRPPSTTRRCGLCSEEGVRWTILAPWQARRAAARRPPCPTRRGRVRAACRALLRRGPLGDAQLRFGGHDRRGSVRAQSSGRACSGRWRAVAAGSAGAAGDPDPIVMAATDGELYGHHQQFRD